MRVMNCIALVAGILLYSASVLGQVKPVAFEEVENLQAKEKKLVLVLIHTDWCKFCQAMKQVILTNRQVSTVLTESFYLVFLNAEEKRRISFAGKNFQGRASGIHELAEALGDINGKMTYPSLCFLNDRNEIIYQYPGFLSSSALYQLITLLSK